MNSSKVKPIAIWSAVIIALILGFAIYNAIDRSNRQNALDRAEDNFWRANEATQKALDNLEKSY